ncbi:MAG: hypothetical protein ACRD1T_03750 [Acidimicrobiia bacterium]
MFRLAVSVLVAASLFFAVTGAWAHHGWGGYDNTKVLNLSGVIRESTYEHPMGR